MKKNEKMKKMVKRKTPEKRAGNPNSWLPEGHVTPFGVPVGVP
jgi:hypothetical protein